MVVGVIDHATGTRDIRRLAWLGQRSRPLLIIAVGATASMAALPPFLGFVAKEADFETVAHSTVTRRRGALRARRHRARLGVHHHLQPAVPAGSVRPQGITGTQQAGGRNAPPGSHFPRRRRRSWPPRAWCSACGRPALDDVLDTYADTVPGGDELPPRAVARVRRCRCCCRCWCSPSARRRSSAAHGCAGCGPSACRWATPTASTTPSLRSLDLSSVRLTAFTQRGSIPATQSVILCHAGAGSRRSCSLSAPATVPSSRCGIRRCRWWSGC